MIVKTDYELMEAKINKIDSNLSWLDASINGFKDIAKFDKSQWSGKAASIYNDNVAKKFPTYLKSFSTACHEYNKYLKQLMRKYQQIDKLTNRN